jgi:hypothetical protein
MNQEYNLCSGEVNISEVNMQENNIVKVIRLTDVFEFTMRKEIMTQEELNIIHSCGFFLKEYFIQDKYIYYTFRRKIL